MIGTRLGTLATRRRFVLPVCAALVLPFLFATIPPLSDLPGHMGNAAVALHAPHDPAFARLMGFRWYPIPNLGCDIIVALLDRWIGVTRAYWLVAAIIPPLIGLGILGLARSLNPRGGAAIGWALIFVYSYPLTYGFLNYMLGVALALLGLAGWIRLDRHPRVREAAAWLAVPLLFLCHAFAGCLFALFVGSREVARWRTGEIDPRALARALRPLLALAAVILLWRLDTRSFAGHNVLALKPKLNALLMMLRDQSLILDVGSLLAAIAVFAIGWRRGARPHPAVVPALLALALLFVMVPSSLSGSEFADMRLLPVLPMLAFATQDWSGIDRRLARIVALSGLVLFATRLAVTTASFANYAASYAVEAQALASIAPHSRVLILNGRNCDALHHWRPDRLGHIGDLALVYRRSWTNSQWDTDGGHLLRIRYRPSPAYSDDPSEYVWPASCGGTAADRPTIADALVTLPYGAIDYLWLIDAVPPPGWRDPRLRLRWRRDASALYSIRHRNIAA